MADIQGEVREFVTANIEDVPPSYFSSQLEQMLKNEGFDAAALVMNGGVGAGASDQNGYWARFAMAEGVGVWAMELTHILCKYMDLYTNDKPNDLGSFDNMDCSCGTHPTAYTKVQLGWLPPSAIVVAPPATSQYDLHSVGLAQPPPQGRVTAVQINTAGNPLFVESRQRVDQFDGGNQWATVTTPQGVVLPQGIASQGVIVYELAGVENPTMPFPGEVDPLIRLRTPTALVAGQSFTSASGVTVQVSAALVGGFTVVIVNAGWSSFFRFDPAFVTKPGTPIAAVARDADHLDLFVTGADGGIHSAYWNSADGWSFFFRIDPGFAKSPGAPIAIVARDADHLDLFVTDADGGINSAYWDNVGGWSAFFRIDPGFAASPGAAVAVVARNPDHLDLFVTGADGGIQSAYWDSASGWSSFFRIDPGFAAGSGTTVAAVARDADHLDLFVTGADGAVHSAYWDSASRWSSFFRIDDAFMTIPSNLVSAVARDADHLDLFVTGADGAVRSAAWDSAGVWSSFFPIDDAFTTTPGASIAAIARNPTHLDSSSPMRAAPSTPRTGTVRADGPPSSNSMQLSRRSPEP